MAGLTKKQIEGYAVVGLVIVAAVLAYSRFLHKPPDAARPSKAVGAAASAHIIPDLPAWLAAGSASVAPERTGHYIPPARDLFAPVSDAPQPESEPSAPQRRQDGLPVLSGTMRRGQAVLAILDGEIVAAGDTIGVYTVVRITETEVTLQQGDARTVIRRSD